MARPPHHHGQGEPKNLPWNRANPKRDCKAVLVMTRLPNIRPGPATRVPARRLAEKRAVATPARGAVQDRPEKWLAPRERSPIPRPPMRAPPTGLPANPKPPPRPTKPLALTPACPLKPPPLPPPPPGPASASVIGGIVRSKIAAMAMPLIKQTLACVGVLSVAARVGARKG